MKKLIEAANYEIDYVFKKFAIGNKSGYHHSNTQGAGLEFKTLDSVINFPDLRRVDWLASERGGHGLPLVRIFEEQKAIQVIVVSDLSASMSFRGSINKVQEIAKLVAALAYSAYRNGDHFGFMGYAEEVLENFSFSPSFSKNIGFEIGEKLWNLEPQGKNHDGLNEIPDHLPQEPSLIFWISDFHTDLWILENFIERTTNHEVIAIILDDEREYKLVKWGPVKILDPETRKEKFLFLYPSLKRKIKERFAEQKSRVRNIFDTHKVDCLSLKSFNPEKINEFLRERGE